MLENSSWFEKYKPRTFDDYVFESQEMKDEVKRWLDVGAIPGNLLLYGPAGTGKSALSSLLINSMIKHRSDLLIPPDKKAETMDNLVTFCIKQPVKSKKKIIYIEEIDRMHPAAMNSLKEKSMEKYQDHVSFICTTNFINGIEHAVRTRFTYKYNLQCKNVEGVYLRLKHILDNEKVQYQEQDLMDFVSNNILMGLRDLINTMQVGVIGNSINFASLQLQRSEQEGELIELTLALFRELFNLQDYNEKRVCAINPRNSKIASQYNSILEIVQYNYEINYQGVLTGLSDKIQFLPIQFIIDKYVHSLHTRKYLHIHYLSFVYESMDAILKISI